METKKENKLVDVPVEITSNYEEINNEVIRLSYNRVYRVDPRTSTLSLNFIDSNRDIKTNKKLEKSIIEDGILSPIVVDENLNIIDGQHRYVIAVNNGIPFDFVIREVGDNTAGIIRDMNNSQKSWSMLDHISFYASQGNENYQVLKELVIKYKGLLPPSFLVKAASGKWELKVTKDNSYRDGKFKIYKDSAELFAKDVTDIAETLNVDKLTRSFLVPFYTVWAYKRYKNKTFIKKMRQTGDSDAMFDRWNSMSDTHKVFEEMINVYNHHYPDNSRYRLEVEYGQHPTKNTAAILPIKEKLDNNKVDLS